MTTVTDPFGTPSEFYNRSGVTIQEISVSPGNPPYATQSVSTHSIFVITASGNLYLPDEGIIIPANTEVGDCVEFYSMSPYTIGIFAPSGENILGVATAEINSRGYRKFLKYNATSWVRT